MSDDLGQARGKKLGSRKTSAVVPTDADTQKKSSPVRLNEEAQSQIGEKLKAIYDDVVNQPIPDRLKELLEQLDNRRPKEKKGRLLN